jgi:hypothetical protein
MTPNSPPRPKNCCGVSKTLIPNSLIWVQKNVLKKVQAKTLKKLPDPKYILKPISTILR